MFITLLFFFFNDTATTEIYTLSLHDALPIYPNASSEFVEGNPSLSHEPANVADAHVDPRCSLLDGQHLVHRSEEHTSELQSRQYLVCRLLLEKKKNKLHNYN